ncbi:NAD(P)H-dependent oxidoreductase [Streptomyces sp. NPDC059349]|uniref:NAD(P)H-dependent oxidoreductase n=1 Tax=Streptomyces sp. NPDC059349 TaxID=3346808 RepID=UPI0036BDE9B7
MSGVKGWIDRVFTSGFAYGTAVPPPYGESSLTGRLALVSVTVGARESAISDRGIHGSLEDVLHPMRHGLFWFMGMNPLEPFAVYSSNELPDDRFVRARTEFARRLGTLHGHAGPLPVAHGRGLRPRHAAPAGGGDAGREGTRLDLHVSDRV